MRRWAEGKMIYGTILLLALLFSGTAVGRARDEAEGGTWYTLIDEQGNVILETGDPVHTGDVYITAENERYVVQQVEDRTGICRYEGQEAMPVLPPPVQRQGLLGDGEKPPVIGIYHTHDDESYVPSDGTESIRGDGGIYDVGAVLKDELEKMGFEVLYSEAKHDPHDVNAYNRSRETAASLMREGGDILIDVHRDAVPPENYETEVDGEAATKIKLVVGQSNPNEQRNMEFAKTVKAAMDETAPGLSAGIYEGRGDYNQDLTPQAILIEVGAHTNRKEEAEKGAVAFARALPAALGTAEEAEKASSSNPGGTESSGTAEAPGEEKAPEAKPLETGEQRKTGHAGLFLGAAAAIAGAVWFVTRART